MILSKNIGEQHYHLIEYEIKKNVHLDLINYIPDKIKVSVKKLT